MGATLAGIVKIHNMKKSESQTTEQTKDCGKESLNLPHSDRMPGKEESSEGANSRNQEKMCVSEPEQENGIVCERKQEMERMRRYEKCQKNQKVTE